MPTITQKTTERPEPVSFSEAFFYWLKLGFISFGGPAGQISMMHQELVEKRRWISEHRFLHALNYTMVLPGPEAQQLATYIGWLMHGVWGGIAAGVLFVIPSLFILAGLTWVYLAYGDVPIVEGILYGIKPAVTAVVVFAGAELFFGFTGLQPGIANFGHLGGIVTGLAVMLLWRQFYKPPRIEDSPSRTYEYIWE